MRGSYTFLTTTRRLNRPGMTVNVVMEQAHPHETSSCTAQPANKGKQKAESCVLLTCYTFTWLSRGKSCTFEVQTFPATMKGKSPGEKFLT